LRSDGPINVLIVHAAPLFHTLVAGALRRCDDLVILPPAGSLPEMRDAILAHHPDVIVLDLALPEPEARELLAALREHYPVPVIACSGSSKADGQRALAAIEAGALDVIVKPPGDGAASVRSLGRELAEKLRAAVREARPVRPVPPGAEAGAPWLARVSFRAAGINPARHLIVIGASTGGTEALRVLMSQMPADAPPIAIVQHMPAFFTPSFAARLDCYSPLCVAEAVDGQPLREGHAVVARGDTHLTVERRPSGWHARYTHHRPVNRHCPSVDTLFDSAVEAAGSSAIGILLTGMGADGAQGLLRLRRCGALTVAQDARSCVVYGMPKAAVELGAAELCGPPEEIPRLVIQGLVSRRRGAAGAAARRR